MEIKKGHRNQCPLLQHDFKENSIKMPHFELRWQFNHFRFSSPYLLSLILVFFSTHMDLGARHVGLKT